MDDKQHTPEVITVGAGWVRIKYLALARPSYLIRASYTLKVLRYLAKAGRKPEK